MKLAYVVLLCTWTLAIETCFAQTVVISQANQLEQNGRFKEAAALLEKSIEAGKRPSAELKTLEFELDRLERIKKDFPLSKDDLFSELQKSVKDLTRSEFDQWVTEGRFDSREIDGKRCFMNASVSNLYFRYPELNPRRTPPKLTQALDKAHWEACVQIKEAALEQKRAYVLPKRFEVNMNVSAKRNAAPPGELISAWLPIPRNYPFQTDFELISSSTPQIHTDLLDSPIRSIFLQQPAKKDAPTEFKITYDFTKYGVYFAVDPGAVLPCPDEPALKQFTGESSHVVFTPEIRALSDKIAAGETNPYSKAKKFYDWIGDQIKYSYAIEYSTIRNISDYCLSRGYGDCGQEALLFISLCRLNGIPARWQSGWDTFPNATTIHDWSEIYIAPYGWIPVDPYMSIYASRYATTLTQAQRKEVKDFFFGGQDWYRIAVNSDHNQTLTPPKKSMRSDDVDFQRGELEWGNHNIYFDNYSYSLTYKELKLPRPE